MMHCMKLPVFPEVQTPFRGLYEAEFSTKSSQNNRETVCCLLDLASETVFRAASNGTIRTYTNQMK